ncbi:hypothetical protein DFH09DRAFT_1367834 [Mycena vulgaris]|nr:hypothetical protein DFH09DRAFT_1367834 [Mycena vulgaris]
MSLASLNEYLILIICLELPVADITSIRKVCRLLYDATRAKVLWITLLERAVRDGQILPPYLKSYDRLDTFTLEALVRRMSRLTRNWESRDLCPNVRYTTQSVPHLMMIWGKRLVILRSSALEFYTLFPGTGEAVLFLKLLTPPTFWEAVACAPESRSSIHIPPLRLVAISPLGLEMCFIEYDALAEDEDHGCPTLCLAVSPYCATYQDPWYHICVAETGRRILWMAAPPEDWIVGADSRFNYMSVPLLRSDKKQPPVPWNDTDPDRPARWAVPVVDFDDTLGLTVIGNCFGELSIYDHGGSQSLRFRPQHVPLKQAIRVPYLFLISIELSRLVSSPSMPISLGLVVAPSPESSLSDWAPITSQWSQDDVELGEQWRTDWLSGGYWDWDQWQGAPSDSAWHIEHQYGFPRPTIPQAYADDVNNDCQHLLFRAGGRYFVFTRGATPALRSWQRAPPPRHFLVTDAQPEYPTRRTAITEADLYNSMSKWEKGWLGTKRDRWAEQEERRST